MTLEIDTDDMEEVFEDNFHILLGILSALARTLRDLQKGRGGGAAIDHGNKIMHIPMDQPLTLVQRMFFIRKVGVLSQSSIEAVADIARESVEEKVKAGTVLWKAGDSSRHSILIVNGTLECRPDEGEPFTFGEGYTVGGMDIIGDLPRWYTAVARTDARLLRMQWSSFLDMLEDHQDTALLMLKTFAHGVNHMLNQMAAEQRKSVAPDDD